MFSHEVWGRQSGFCCACRSATEVADGGRSLSLEVAHFRVAVKLTG